MKFVLTSKTRTAVISPNPSGIEPVTNWFEEKTIQDQYKEKEKKEAKKKTDYLLNQ
jgi:hypothetical protein